MKRHFAVPLLFLLAGISICLGAELDTALAPAVLPDLQLDSLGSIVITGDFDGVSQYQYAGQVGNYTAPSLAEGFPDSGWSTILQQLPNGAFTVIAETDAYISSMCVFANDNGTNSGVVVAGNFTYVGSGAYATGAGVDARAAAVISHFDGSSYRNITALPGILGTISSIFYDSRSELVYICGNFAASGSSNVIAYKPSSGSLTRLVNTDGTNGPITAMVTLPSGHLLFGGNFEEVLFLDTSALGSTVPKVVNRLWEYDPEASILDVEHTPIEEIGMTLGSDDNTHVRTLLQLGAQTFVGGQFQSPTSANIMVIANGTSRDLGDGGLNDAVFAMVSLEDVLYVGGNFTNTARASATGAPQLWNLAANVGNGSWKPMGGGVNGWVTALSILKLNISSGPPETVIFVNGVFDLLLAYNQYGSIPVTGSGVWVPSHGTWLQNIPGEQPVLKGSLTQSLISPSSDLYAAGTLSLYDYRALGAASLLSDKKAMRFAQLPANNIIHFKVGAGPLTSTGAFSHGLNITIISGHFTAQLDNNVTARNIVFIGGGHEDKLSTAPLLPPASNSSLEELRISALTVQNSVLYAGGEFQACYVDQEVDSLFLYDLLLDDFVKPQPPRLHGPRVSVSAIAIRPQSGEIYIGGTFTGTADIDCPGICIWDSTASQWRSSGPDIEGQVDFLVWVNQDSLVAVGNLTVGHMAVSLATYYAPKRRWVTFNLDQPIPGQITAIIAANVLVTSPKLSSWSSDSQSFWIAGQGHNDTAFLMKWDGQQWTHIEGIFEQGTQIKGLELLSIGTPHRDTRLLESNQLLAVMGMLVLPSAGNVSAALFNGTSFQPFILTTKAGSVQSGSITSIRAFDPNVSISNRLESYETRNAIAIGVTVLCILVAIIIFGEIQGRRGWEFQSMSFLLPTSAGGKKLQPRKASTAQCNVRVEIARSSSLLLPESEECRN